MTATTLVWFRDDLRLADNPALTEAAKADRPVVGLYVLDEESEGIRPLGGAARWWLHHSLARLDASLHEAGGRLVLRRGPAARVVPEVAEAVRAEEIHWNRRYGAAERAVDAGLKESLTASGRPVHSHAASLLAEPWTIRTGQDAPYRVFTPFWNALSARPAPRAPLPAPGRLAAGRVTLGDRESLADLGLLPTHPDWAGGLRETWTPGEEAALAELEAWADDGVIGYREAHDDIGADDASRLSPRLRWGELSPFQVWDALRRHRGSADVAAYRRQLGWRDFGWHLLYARPEMGWRNMREEFDAVRWRSEEAEIEAWRRGRTGYDLVDAGMTELWRTGYMHNRVRMVTASFLTKNLLAHWTVGERWFWDTLVDADPAENAMNWQWVAGTGVDSAPFFRVFNPERQAETYDPDGTYRRRWGAAAERAEPLVDLAATRKRALDEYARVRRG